MSNDNDKKISEYKKKKLSKVIIIALYFLVIVLELLALFGVIDMMWGIIIFIPLYLLKKNI